MYLSIETLVMRTILCLSNLKRVLPCEMYLKFYQLADRDSGGFKHLERGGSGCSTTENFWVAMPISGHVNAFMTHVIIVVAS